jgi:hypothetical protein
VLLGGQAAPRVRHAPSVRANSWEDVSDLSASFGLVLDEWQENVFQAALGERSDGRWAARTVGLSTPRQNGKSQLIVARALAGILLFDEQLIICSAHQQDTAREVFTRLVDLLEDNPTLNARVDSYGKALNREYIRFKSGQVIRFKARSAGGGRGFSADCLLLDEAQILSAQAWAAILPTMSARPNPQVWLLGTPPTPVDDGEVFGRIRAAGLEGKDTRLAYLEWSADAADDFDAPETWAKANPAYGVRIGPDAIEAERSSMSDDQFGMERLGMWAAAGSQRVIPAAMWDAAGDDRSVAVDKFALGVEVAPDLVGASVSLAGLRADGSWHVELDESRDGVDWLGPYVEALITANPQIRGVGLDLGSPAKAVVEQRGDDWFLKGTNVRIIAPKVQDLGGACSELLAGVVGGWVKHIRQGQLTAAVGAAGKRNLGDTGLWVWHRSSAAADITPVQAVTLALWVARLDKIFKKPLRRREGSGGRQGVVL